MHFEDIVPKPNREYKDVFTKESFDELPDQKKWDHAIELVLDSQAFSTRSTPWPQLSRSSWMTSLMRTSEANVYAHLSH